MVALSLRFPAGRYHATPWGRHVNEAAIAWPPEPLRILRALIACHHRKADKALFSDSALADLIDTLAVDLPRYHLPEGAVHAHTRHYMPAPMTTTLVFDAFVRFDPREAMIIGWPDGTLSADQHAHLSHLAERLGYLGRAESWVEAKVVDCDGQSFNAIPAEGGTDEGDTIAAANERSCLVPLYAPLPPARYRETRERLINDERERRRAAWTKKAKPTDKAITKDMARFLDTLPERLVDALAVETSDLQAAGWSDPPATQRVHYQAPEPSPTWRGRRRHRPARSADDPTVARFVLAGRPPPRIEDTVKIAEIMRAATMSMCSKVPSVISGRGEDGKPLSDDHHGHAFWLPEDADQDGEIDHIVVYAADSFGEGARRGLDRVTRLWLDRSRRVSNDEDETADSGRKEWRLALEGFGEPADFAAVSTLLRRSTHWQSVTPYLMPWYEKKSLGWQDQIRRELSARGLPEPQTISDKEEICLNGRKRRPIHFHRFRSRRGLRQPDALGRFVELTFERPVCGPLALGFGCHFGLGLFRSQPE